jgi:hypothetical protein
MHSAHAGLIEYFLIVGLVLALAVIDLVYLERSRRMRKGNNERTKPQRNRSSDKLS